MNSFIRCMQFKLSGTTLISLAHVLPKCLPMTAFLGKLPCTYAHKATPLMLLYRNNIKPKATELRDPSLFI